METALTSFITRRTNRAHAYLFGRGTTALFVALRALIPDGRGEVILPDIICSTVADAVILAGLTPVFADVTADRFAMSRESVRARITPQTRAIIAAHVFGYISNVDDLREFGLPIIEDAVQGYGGATPDGRRAGTLGDISIIGFDTTKIVHGRGGVVLTDDPALAQAIERVTLDAAPKHAVPPFSQYRRQIDPVVGSLLCPFNDTAENVQQITAGIDNLSQLVRERNAKAQYVRERLGEIQPSSPAPSPSGRRGEDSFEVHHPRRGDGLPRPLLPPIVPGDAIWRYTFAVPNKTAANRILRQMQLAGLPGAKPYPALSTIFAPEPSLLSADLAPRLINVWVDEAVSYEQLDGIISIIR